MTNKIVNLGLKKGETASSLTVQKKENGWGINIELRNKKGQYNGYKEYVVTDNDDLAEAFTDFLNDIEAA